MGGEGALAGIVDDHADAGRNLQDPGIAEAGCLGVAVGGEVVGADGDGQPNAEMAAELRGGDVRGARPDRARVRLAQPARADDDLVDVLHADPVLVHNPADRVDLAVDETHAAVRLEADAEQVVALAEFLDGLGSVEAVRECLEHTPATLENCRRAGEPTLGEQCRADPAGRRDAGVEPFDITAGLAVFERSRGVAARDAKRVERVVGIELECLGGRGGGAKWALHRGLVKAALDDRGVPARPADPEEYLGRERRGREQSAAVQMLLLGHGQRCGDGDASGVGEAADMKIVDLEAVSERGIDERRALRMSLQAVPDYGAVPDAAEASRMVVDECVPRQGRGRELATDLVEDHVLRLVHDLRGKVLVSRATHESRQGPCRFLPRHPRVKHRRRCGRHPARIRSRIRLAG